MTRVRFAPSPTGFLHIGGARTYIFNWLFAHQRGGTMVLRIDDTDRARSTDEARRSILEGLRWLELPWDEEHSQSERRSLHVEAAEALLAKDVAYRDFTAAPATAEPKDKASRTWLANPGMREQAERLAGLDEFNEESVKAALRGQSVGPSAFAIFSTLGKERVIGRLRRV